MKTLEITKYQARQALNTFYFAVHEVENKDINYLKHETNGTWASISPIKIDDNGNYYYQRISEGNTYQMDINVDEMVVSSKIKINGEVFSLLELTDFLDDLKTPEQEKFLKNIDITVFERYLEKRCGGKYPITLKKEIYQNKDAAWIMDLTTDNLVELSGICQAMLKEIHISCKGIGFSIDNYTGEQFLYIPHFDFYYQHITNGCNGHEMGRVRFNQKENRFEGYNYETDEFEVLK